MANLDDIYKREKELQDKNSINNPSGVQLWKVFMKVNQETGKSRLRFLTPFKDGFAVKWHKNNKDKEFGEWGINKPCWRDPAFDFDGCEYCDSPLKMTARNDLLYCWFVWDYETSLVRIYAGRNNNKTMAGKLWSYFEENGDITERDFNLKLDGMDYSLVPVMQQSEFQFADKVKIPTEQKGIISIVLAQDPELAKEMSWVPTMSIIPASEDKEKNRKAPTNGTGVDFKKRLRGVPKDDTGDELPEEAEEVKPATLFKRTKSASSAPVQEEPKKPRVKRVVAEEPAQEEIRFEDEDEDQ